MIISALWASIKDVADTQRELDNTQREIAKTQIGIVNVLKEMNKFLEKLTKEK